MCSRGVNCKEDVLVTAVPMLVGLACARLWLAQLLADVTFLGLVKVNLIGHLVDELIPTEEVPVQGG